MMPTWTSTSSRLQPSPVLASVQAGIMQAARNQNYQEPLFINGIKWVMNSKEAYGVMNCSLSSTRPRRKSFKYDGSLINTCRRSSGRRTARQVCRAGR